MARTTPQRHGRRGFSILELVIVLATISVLASIAIPNMRHAFKRARAVEAAQTVAELERCLKAYYNAKGEYPSASGPKNPPFAGFERQPMNLSLPGWKELDFKSEALYRYRYEIETSANGSGKFLSATLRAYGDTDDDGHEGEYLRSYEDGFLVLETVIDD